TCMLPSGIRPEGVGAAGHTWATSNDVADAIAIPGAEMSGFWRPSRVGPGLEKVARLPTAGVPENVLSTPLHAVQFTRDTHAATVMRSAALPGSLTSS